MIRKASAELPGEGKHGRSRGVTTRTFRGFSRSVLGSSEVELLKLKGKVKNRGLMNSERPSRRPSENLGNGEPINYSKSRVLSNTSDYAISSPRCRARAIDAT